VSPLLVFHCRLYIIANEVPTFSLVLTIFTSLPGDNVWPTYENKGSHGRCPKMNSLIGVNKGPNWRSGGGYCKNRIEFFLGAKSTSIRDCVGRLVCPSVCPHDAITWKTGYVAIPSHLGIR
jgi:hypothetical protein